MTAAHPLTLRQNFSWTLAGNVVFNGCQWGILIVLARLGSAETVGRFALGSAVAAPVLMLANLQLRTVQATDAGRVFSFPEYRRLRLLTSAAAVFVVASVALLFYGGERAVVIALFGVVKALEALSDIHHGLFQLCERMDFVGRSLALRGALNLVGFSVVYYGTGQLATALLALAASSAVTIVLVDARGARRLQGPAKRRSELRPLDTADERRWWPRARALILLALPLGVVMMLISLEANLPRYFIEGRIDEAALGVFAVVAYFNAAGATLVGALAQAAVPRLAKLFACSDIDEFRLVLTRLLVVAAGVGAVGVAVAAVCGGLLLRLLYGAGFAGHQRLFVLLMIAGAANLIATSLGAPVSAMRLFSVQVWIHMANVVMLIGMLFLAVGSLGLDGAAYAMAVSGCALSLAYAAQVRKGLGSLAVATRVEVE